MLVYYSGLGYWYDYDGKLTVLIRQSGLFELPYDKSLDIKYKQQTYSNTLDACFGHEDGAVPPGYINDGERYFFKMVRITPEGEEFAEEVSTDVKLI